MIEAVKNVSKTPGNLQYKSCNQPIFHVDQGFMPYSSYQLICFLILYNVFFISCENSGYISQKRYFYDLGNLQFRKIMGNLQYTFVIILPFVLQC